jgi:hypothetical protein
MKLYSKASLHRLCKFIAYPDNFRTATASDHMLALFQILLTDLITSTTSTLVTPRYTFIHFFELF